jgi:predicted transposase/invertase (TIGR01784 family)
MVRLNPLNDFCFLSILGRRGCEPQLLSFLNALLYPSGDNPIRSVEIIEHTALPAEIISGKKSVLDVRALLVDKTQINIEVQLTNEYNIEQRSLYYWARQYTQGIGAGQDYKELPRVIAIEAVPKPQFWNSFLPLEKIA